MTRPYIEFIHSQQLAWSPAPPPFGGAQWKRLSEDDETGAVTALLKFGPGRSALPAQLQSDWELFVLAGAARLGALQLDLHRYCYLPRGFPLESLECDGELLLLSFFSSRPLAAAAGATGFAPSAAIGPLDTIAMPWDRSGIDPNINHLNAARKNLRFAPEGNCRTYLLGGMPQGFPPTDTPLETHPHVEEFFMVSGDMSVHCGIMRAGAYFWRPPGIPHGRDCTRTGYLLFCRTPGSNRTISEWSRERYSVSFSPAHLPVLPESLRAAGAVPIPDPLVY
jgi:hypothetical protein